MLKRTTGNKPAKTISLGYTYEKFGLKYLTVISQLSLSMQICFS